MHIFQKDQMALDDNKNRCIHILWMYVYDLCVLYPHPGPLVALADPGGNPSTVASRDPPSEILPAGDPRPDPRRVGGREPSPLTTPSEGARDRLRAIWGICTT